MASGSQNIDAVVIGAGVIGSAVALELARRGRKVVCVDKLPAAGYGSTSSSSAVVRFSYSTLSGVALSYEAYRHWVDWPNHIGPIGDQNLAEYVAAPMLMPKTPGGHHEKVLPHFDALGIPYEDLSAEECQTRWPYLDLRIFGPPATLEDVDSFWGEPSVIHDGAISMPEAGYISDPQLAAANLAAAAIREGATFRYNTCLLYTSPSPRDS